MWRRGTPGTTVASTTPIRARERRGRPGLSTLSTVAVVSLLGVTGVGLVTAGLTAPPPRPPAPDVAAPAAPAVPAASRPPRALPPLPHAAPTLIRIPSIGVRAEIIPVGVDATGVLEVPPLDRPGLAGWYRHGVSPGETGNAVLVGHVDSPTGPAVFFHLGRLRPGDTVRVSRADTRVATFTVDRVDTYPKDAFPSDLVYGPAGSAGLRLLTCGGRFDEQAGEYVDNIIVFASRTG
ncbi:class F sortase [Micromonospora sp. NPDC005367]|uniref:class F sortase n=1 Tax=Micromonospora sp. NPDC005367 TaxID=3155590 RepID=UPI00339F3483